jgi:hypothetical protein
VIVFLQERNYIFNYNNLAVLTHLTLGLFGSFEF